MWSANAELKGVQSANLTVETVVRDKVPGTVEVPLSRRKTPIPTAGYLSREEGAEPGELYSVKLPGADLDGEDRDDFDQRQASDEQFGARLVDHPIHNIRARFDVIVLDEGAGVEEIARHQKRSALRLR